MHRVLCDGRTPLTFSNIANPFTAFVVFILSAGFVFLFCYLSMQYPFILFPIWWIQIASILDVCAICAVCVHFFLYFLHVLCAALSFRNELRDAMHWLMSQFAIWMRTSVNNFRVIAQVARNELLRFESIAYDNHTDYSLCIENDMFKRQGNRISHHMQIFCKADQRQNCTHQLPFDAIWLVCDCKANEGNRSSTSNSLYE